MNDDRVISVQFRLLLEDGTEVAKSSEDEPLRFRPGRSEILPALETALDGLDVGGSRTVTLAPEDAFGPVDPEGFKELPPDTLPEEARKVGILMDYEDQNGNEGQFRVHEVRDDAIVVDLNHPLAGRTVVFEVEVVGIE